ncbi:MAG TPA: DoxX family protein [Vicinamibacteria bacterium]|nr:DoxX family protein [Vicinamibacteria bacterium]
MATSGKVVWVGWGLSIMASLLFLFSAFLKFKGGPDIDQAMTHLGLPASMVLPLGILELTCTVIYLIPATAVLGAILLAGYVGGTIVTCWRVGDPFIINIALGLVVWLGIYLREPRLKELIPLRRHTGV